MRQALRRALGEMGGAEQATHSRAPASDGSASPEQGDTQQTAEVAHDGEIEDTRSKAEADRASTVKGLVDETREDPQSRL